MTDLLHQRPWFRARDALPFMEWYNQRATRQCALALHGVPEDMLANRDALTACLTQEWHDLGRRQAEAMTSHWQAAWEERMAGPFVDLPNMQNEHPSPTSSHSGSECSI